MKRDREIDDKRSKNDSNRKTNGVDAHDNDMKRDRETTDADDMERNENDRETADADDMEWNENDCDHETNGVDAHDNDLREDHELDNADDVERADTFCDCEVGIDGSDEECDSVSDSGIRAKNNENVVIDFQKAGRDFGKMICSFEVHPVFAEVTFKTFFHSLRPLLKFEIDFDSFKGDCLQIYEEEKARVKSILRNMVGQISLSVDVLRYETRKGNVDDFMCLAAHFIDDSWKLKKWVLSFCRIRDENCDFLHEAILKSLKDWEIEGKISTFTLLSLDDDDEDEIVEKVKTQVQEKKRLQLNGQLFRVNCCAAMFNLMVQDAFDEISKITRKLYELCWNKSLSPLWYITTTKLKHALMLQSMGEFSSQDVQDFYDVPSNEEWKQVEGVCKLADSAHNIAKVLFDTKYPTANIYLYNLQELRTILTQESIGSCSFTSNVAKKMLARLDKYWKNAFMVLAIASVMDPRLKMKYIECFCSKSEGSDGNSQVTLVLDAIQSLYDDYLNSDLEREYSMVDSTSSDSEEESPRSVEQGTGSPKWLQEYKQFIQSSGRPAKSDLDWYLEEPVVPWSQDFNARKWWRAESPKYPTLSKMARDFLAIPLSIATSFAAYYTEPRPADRYVISSGPDLMNALMCTHSWLQKRQLNFGATLF